MQTKIKSSSVNLVLFSFKLVTGIFLGLVLTLIGQETIGYGNFAFFFVIVMVAGVFLRISKSWGGWGVVIFNLVIFLIGMILKLYITVAPGA
jgi:hypothetical protein